MQSPRRLYPIRVKSANASETDDPDIQLRHSTQRLLARSDVIVNAIRKTKTRGPQPMGVKITSTVTVAQGRRSTIVAWFRDDTETSCAVVSARREHPQSI